MDSIVLKLPDSVTALIEAHSTMCRYFEDTGLSFTLDGKLVGDIGEALVAMAFGISLCRRRMPGIDGFAIDGRSVQIKATGLVKSGPAFTPGEGVADHLIFVRIDFKDGNASVLYNGPEAPIRRMLPNVWTGTKVVSLLRIRAADREVDDKMRLSLV